MSEEAEHAVSTKTAAIATLTLFNSGMNLSHWLASAAFPFTPCRVDYASGATRYYDRLPRKERSPKGLLPLGEAKPREVSRIGTVEFSGSALTVSAKPVYFFQSRLPSVLAPMGGMQYFSRRDLSGIPYKIALALFKSVHYAVSHSSVVKREKRVDQQEDLRALICVAYRKKVRLDEKDAWRRAWEFNNAAFDCCGHT
jgi:hypothetical protein